jgi:ssDNA-binding Zn-finger/Zn-ribbon topoisomerase 1
VDALAGLIVLEDVSSLQLMAGTLPDCPLCGGGLQPKYWRAGLATFVAAAACPTCKCLVRANDAFSIEPEPTARGAAHDAQGS